MSKKNLSVPVEDISDNIEQLEQNIVNSILKSLEGLSLEDKTKTLSHILKDIRKEGENIELEKLKDLLGKISILQNTYIEPIETKCFDLLDEIREEIGFFPGGYSYGYNARKNTPNEGNNDGKIQKIKNFIKRNTESTEDKVIDDNDLIRDYLNRVENSLSEVNGLLDQYSDDITLVDKLLKETPRTIGWVPDPLKDRLDFLSESFGEEMKERYNTIVFFERLEFLKMSFARLQQDMKKQIEINDLKEGL